MSTISNKQTTHYKEYSFHMEWKDYQWFKPNIWRALKLFMQNLEDIQLMYQKVNSLWTEYLYSKPKQTE